MVKCNELSKGDVIEYNNQTVKIDKMTKTMQGRGSNFLSVELRDVNTGKKGSARLRTDEKVELVDLTKSKWQFLYEDAGVAYFMEPTLFEQVDAPASILGNYQYYVAPGEEVNLYQSEKGALVMSDCPLVAVTTIESMGGDRGETRTRYATAVNGRTITKVANHVQAGQKIEVSVDSEEYLRRVND